jgi:transcriptional regulator with XRE-family HTH domain
VVKSTLTTCAQVAEVTVEITLLDRVAHRARAGQGEKLKKKVKEVPMILVRQEIGEVLRDVRLQKGRTLRQVAGRASVALGYLSEVERGQKEASSEILASVADALDTPISVIMREVGDRLAILEGVSVVPDTLTDELVAQFDVGLALR